MSATAIGRLSPAMLDALRRIKRGEHQAAKFPRPTLSALELRGLVQRGITPPARNHITLTPLGSRALAANSWEQGELLP